MGYININTGGFDDDPNADKIRIAFNKVKTMFSELFTWQNTLESELNNFANADYVNVAYNALGDNKQINVVNSINEAGFSFIVSRGKSMYVTTVVGKDEGVFLMMTYLLRGNGTFGGGASFLNNDSVIKINEERTDPVTVIDVGDIGGFSISAFINSNPPIEPIGLTLIETTVDSYLFLGASGIYGFGATPTTVDNFININTIPDL